MLSTELESGLSNRTALSCTDIRFFGLLFPVSLEMRYLSLSTVALCRSERTDPEENLQVLRLRLDTLLKDTQLCQLCQQQSEQPEL